MCPSFGIWYGTVGGPGNESKAIASCTRSIVIGTRHTFKKSWCGRHNGMEEEKNRVGAGDWVHIIIIVFRISLRVYSSFTIK